MEFLKHLKENEHEQRMRKELDEKYLALGLGTSDMRRLELLENDEASVFLSIQGSGGHYSTPREVVPLDQYSTMEVAVKRTQDHEFITVDEVTNDPEIIAAFAECYSDPVYSYVPVEWIERLYQDAFKQEAI